MPAALALASSVVACLALAAVVVAAALLLFPSLRRGPATLLEKHLFPDANTIMLRNARPGGPPAATDAGRRVYRILAFGDSLTEGFTQGGVDFHPYITKLGDTLYPQLPKGWHLEVEEQGESGERVLTGMRHRLQRALDEHRDAARPYDWVLLLGGINDLAGDSSSAAEVMQGLRVLVEACLQHGANVLLMTVLEVAEILPSVEQQRLQLNTLIQQYVQERSWAQVAAAGSNSPQLAQATRAQQQQQQQTPVARRGAPKVVLFDLAAQLTWHGMSQEARWEYWDDGVHLSRDGYDLMGSHIAAALCPLIKAELPAAASDAAVADQLAAPNGSAANGVVAGSGKKLQ